MEPRWPAKGSSHSREMRHGPSAPSMPQKDAYSRLLSQHHSSAFRAYLEQFAREQHLQTDHNRPSLAGTGALETNGCSPHPAKDTESESCLSLYMGRLNGRGGAPVLEPPGPKPGSGARRARRGERRDTNTSQDADVESSEEGLLKHPKPPKKQQHGGGGAFKTPVVDAGTSGPVGLTGGQQHNKQKHKKKNTAKNKMDAAPEGGRSAGADSSVMAAPKGYMGRVKAAQPQDQVHSAQLTPDKNKSKNKGGRGKKKQVFEAYLSLEEVSKELKRGELIQGPLRINPKKYHEAFIPSPDSMRDIFLDGVAARNRALNGDIVVVKLLPREQWKVIKSDTDGEGNGESENPATGTSAQGSTVGAKPNPDVIVEAQFSDGEDDAPGTDALASKVETMNLQSTTGSHSSGDVKTVADKFLQRTGKVVYIAQQKHSRAATGFLKFLPDKSFAMFSPVDHRVPRVNVPLADCPADFAARPDDYASILFICRITDWPGDSTFAEGLGVAVLDLNYFIDECKITQSNVRLVKSLGLAGEIEPETEGILTEYDVDFAEFSEDVLQCLPQDLPWTIPVDEFTKRRDLRLECIFTIDPATARDLDDALSCKPLPDGNFEVGVHIADVSYFVDEGSLLDGVASRRATSVYLVQKVVPMLPRLLCEELCSLNPMTDRLTFSVIWKITPEGKILSEWFGRTVIRSCVKLSYDHAQSMIDSPDAPPGPEQLPPFAPEHPVAEIHRAVLDLHRIARRLRSQRFESGALRLDQSKLSFTLDKESGMPQGCYIYQYRDSNKLVEEFMLLANMATAHRVYRSFPEYALLRRHPPPQTKMVDDLTEFCDQMGLSLDFSSAGSLHRSLNETLGTDQYSCARKEVLTHMCSRPMQMAVYFCTGVLMDEPQFRHYALNVPFYTHFTSPIRRYADVIVHRLLGAALGCSPHPSLEAEDVQRQASHCNDKKTASKRVQELSSELFFAAFVKECGPLDSEAMVMGVLDQSFDVLVLKYGVQKRIYCKMLQGLKDFHFRKVGKKPELTLVWAADETMRGPVEQEISIFTLVEVQLQADAAPMKYSATLKRPSPTGP